MQTPVTYHNLQTRNFKSQRFPTTSGRKAEREKGRERGREEGRKEREGREGKEGREMDSSPICQMRNAKLRKEATCSRSKS